LKWRIKKTPASNVEQFLLYLWGIEILFCIHNIRSFIFKVFTLPMRNWNEAARQIGVSRAAVFTLPMRNWNAEFDNTSIIFDIVFTLPMRNWNVVKQSCWGRDSAGFYFTYEELKPAPRLNASMTYLCFYFTYEELKLVFLPAHFQQRPCLYFTYEELKQGSGHFGCDFCKPFLLYLWGIETEHLYR